MTSWPVFEWRGPEVTERDVEGFEKRFGIALPHDYRAFLLEVNGGRTANTNCEFDRGVVNLLFSLSAPKESFDLTACNERMREDLKTLDLVSVGADDGGGDILLAVNGDHSDEIWLQLHEERPWDANPRVLWHDRRDFRKLADSFTAFMASLRPLRPVT